MTCILRLLRIPFTDNFLSGGGKKNRLAENFLLGKSIMAAVSGPIIDGFPDIQIASKEQRNEAAERLFLLGFSNKEILGFFSMQGAHLSIRQLKRVLNGRNLYRRKNHSPLAEIIESVHSEQRYSGQRIGYRQMWQRLRNDHHVGSSRETVRLVMKILDPDGVELRRKRRLKRRTYFNTGPNFCWHVDGNDKLKTYGLYIHGCIDGYSRKIMWLTIGRTNKDETVVAKHYLNTIKKIKGVPLKLRFDPGTENGLIGDIHALLRGGGECVIYGKSTANQRIECWWSYLKKNWLCWWIDFFEDMVEEGILDTSSYLHLECVRFLFTSLLQTELDRVKRLWNTHWIRKVSQSICPPGRPDTIYNSPANYGAENHIHEVDGNLILAIDNVHESDDQACSNECLELFLFIMHATHQQFPTNPISCKMLFKHIMLVIAESSY